MSMLTTGTIWTRRTIHVYTEGNPGSTRNQLSYWTLAFEVRPHFQHAPKIQHRCRMSVVRILWVRAHRMSCLDWKGDKNPGAGFYKAGQAKSARERGA